MKVRALSLIAFIVAICISSQAFAAGMITGRVVDKDSGEPLVGANITVEGTTLGASTDLDGNYTVRMVQPGAWTVSATVLGYKKMTRNDRGDRCFEFVGYICYKVAPGFFKKPQPCHIIEHDHCPFFLV